MAYFMEHFLFVQNWNLRNYLNDIIKVCGYYYSSDGIFTSQLILTKDWDLVKRYLFFMIRNHQYENFQVDYPDCIDDYLPEGFPLNTSDFDRVMWYFN